MTRDFDLRSSPKLPTVDVPLFPRFDIEVELEVVMFNLNGDGASARWNAPASVAKRQGGLHFADRPMGAGSFVSELR